MRAHRVREFILVGLLRGLIQQTTCVNTLILMAVVVRVRGSALLGGVLRGGVMGGVRGFILLLILPLRLRLLRLSVVALAVALILIMGPMRLFFALILVHCGGNLGALVIGKRGMA